ncbi:PE-PGRS family protein PE_PGRS16-like [Schistocerca americana]|uniref:PE-PGRS family protein PE_PGRS16-like n=1 Tax=Schistocerca americana TaxID=7009 RepID=UPI001F4FFEDC|nr:PE-PGRS family protein PE_PGRS16-like [Schistocerca americana]
MEDGLEKKILGFKSEVDKDFEKFKDDVKETFKETEFELSKKQVKFENIIKESVECLDKNIKTQATECMKGKDEIKDYCKGMFREYRQKTKAEVEDIRETTAKIENREFRKDSTGGQGASGRGGEGARSRGVEESRGRGGPRRAEGGRGGLRGARGGRVGGEGARGRGSEEARGREAEGARRGRGGAGGEGARSRGGEGPRGAKGGRGGPRGAEGARGGRGGARWRGGEGARG